MRKFLSVLGAFILLSFVGYLIYLGAVVLLDFWTGLAIALTLTALGILYWGFKPEVDRLAKRKRQKLGILNNELFKPWKNVSIFEEPFRIRIIIEERSSLPYSGKGTEPSSLTYFEVGREWLNSKSDSTRKIWQKWKEIEGLKSKHNDMGNETKKKTGDYLSKAYPSLKSLEAGKVGSQDCCYVIDNIINLVWYRLKESFLRNGHLDWGNIRFEEEQEDNVWRLVCNLAWRVFVQSKNREDIDKEHFKNIMESLFLETSKELRELNELRDKIVQSLGDFRGKMNSLTIDIDLKKVN